MKKEIIINSTLNVVRLAITEDGKLVEFFIEMPDKERSVGNIYYGKVNKIVQGINAAFIDIGTNHDAFLHFSDVDDTLENLIIDDDEDEEDSQEHSQIDFEPFTDDIIPDEQLIKEIKEEKKATSKKEKSKQITFKTKKLGNIQINLEQNQNVIVQIVREAYGSKGVRVTSRIGLPGRYVVLLPYENMVGVSRKINSVVERKRLRSLARHTIPKECGCIIRTAAEGKSEVELKKDFDSLLDTWKEIEEKIKNQTKPGLIYQDMELATSVIRDLFTADVNRVVVDSKKLYKEIYNYVKWAAPSLIEKIELYSEKKPIFDYFGIEKELSNTYKPKAFLPGGGSLVIEQTEAMFVIDVNSGRSISDNLQEQNALNTNLEAVKEIARQIRLRDMSGMIIVDFIDLSKENNRKRIYYEMKKELQKDRAKAVVYPLTQLCLMQITRKRVNQYITEKVTEICPTCLGSGRIASKSVLLNSIERWLKNFRVKSREFRITLEVHPHIATFLSEGTFSRLSRLMIKYFVRIKLQQNELIHIDKFRFYSDKKQKDITQEFM